jgi:hypothetical protein
MLWGQDWTWSIPIIVLTIVIHVVVLSSIVSRSVRIIEHPARIGGFLLRYAIIIGSIAFLSTLLLAFESWLWAATYVRIGALPDIREAMLFSLGAITSYGNTSVKLAPHWELMGALEALNGIMLFGLTTAFFFGAIQSVQARVQRQGNGSVASAISPNTEKKQ